MPHNFHKKHNWRGFGRPRPIQNYFILEDEDKFYANVQHWSFTHFLAILLKLLNNTILLGRAHNAVHILTFWHWCKIWTL